jgi:hypothetical protein
MSDSRGSLLRHPGKMARGPYARLSDSIRLRIIDLRRVHPASEISKQLKIPVRTVRHVVAKARAGLPLSKKRGRRLPHTPELEAVMVDEVRALRLQGVPVGTTEVRAVALLKDKEERGDAARPCSRFWAHRAVRRWGLSFRRGTQSTKSARMPQKERILAQFRTEFREKKTSLKIPDSLIINVDEVGVDFVPVPAYTYEMRGARQVPMFGRHDRRQMTMVLGTAAAGDVLPPQLIYRGTTTRCHPKTKFPDGWDLRQTTSHWATKATMLQYVDSVLRPYLSATRARLNLPPDQPALLVLDAFVPHHDALVVAAVERLNCSILQVPRGLTGDAQPNDAAFNRSFKAHLKSAFSHWYFRTVVRKHTVRVDLRLKVLRELHVKWVREAFDFVMSRPDIVRRSWVKAGLCDAP